MNPSNRILDPSQAILRHVPSTRSGDGRLPNSPHELGRIEISLVVSWKVQPPAICVGLCTAAPENSGVSA